MKSFLIIFMGLISTQTFAQNIVAPSQLLQCDNELNSKSEDVFTYNPKGTDDYYVVTSKTILKKTLSAPSNWSAVKEVTKRVNSAEQQRTIHSSIYRIDANSSGIDKTIYVQTSWSKYDSSPDVTRIGLGTIRMDQVGKSPI